MHEEGGARRYESFFNTKLQEVISHLKEQARMLNCDISKFENT